MTLSPERVATLLHDACLAELDALKPGNVHRHGDGHGMTVADFETSAAVTAEALSHPDRSVGEMIERAVQGTLAAVGCNTNLGIVLLCAPLAKAALHGEGWSLRHRLAATLEGLDVDDSRRAFAAIAAAGPAGLGHSDAEDVHEPPSLSLRDAMVLARARDRIACQYASGFADVFDKGLPWIRSALARGDSLPWGLSRAYLGFLAAFPDSHILRKQGAEIAESVRREAVDWDRRIEETEDTASLTVGLLAFDRDLKARGINPGTSADLTVASCLAHRLDLVFAEGRPR